MLYSPDQPVKAGAPLIKFCGMMSREDILAANRLHPDYVGFVFAPHRRRTVSMDLASDMRDLLLTDILAVGVFVNQSPKEVAEYLLRGVIDVVQLHGDEDETYADQLRGILKRAGMSKTEIWKAFVLKDRETETLKRIEGFPADRVLVDSGTGGGVALAWDDLAIKRPFFLAGGLSVENVNQALDACRPIGVDVSSGIETDGKKDEEKMAAFIAAVRGSGR